MSREIKEELDLEIEVGKKVAETPGDLKNYMLSWYKCNLLTTSIKIDENEIEEAGWFTKEEMEKDIKIWPKTFEFLQKYIENKVI